jgi:hypothetical protein
MKIQSAFLLATFAALALFAPGAAGQTCVNLDPLRVMRRKYSKFGTMAQLLAMGIGLLVISRSALGAASYFLFNIGPQPINMLDGNNNLFEQDSGRVTSLAVDPSNSNHWLIGAAQGGVWETTNAGAAWDPRTDDQASLAMGAIAFAPGNPSVVYAGTGEANFRGDSYAGAGLLLSQDGGTQWQMLNSSFAKTSFSRIRVSALNSSNLVVATARGGAGVGEESSGHGNVPGAPPRGVFMSVDGGAGFTPVLTGEATALEANPNDFNQQYAGLGEIYGDPATNGVYRTMNGWQGFQLISGPWITNVSLIYTVVPIATNIVINCNTNPCQTNIIVVYTNILTGTNVTTNTLGRIAMAISPSDPNILYVGLAGARTNYIASLIGIWVTSNAWDTTPNWTQLPDPNVGHNGVDRPRFWYMFDLLVEPTNSAVLYLAEFNVWRYASGNWNPLTGWYDIGMPLHPDNHVMAWVPGAGPSYRMLLGNDGGAYLSAPGVSGPWTSLNAGLRITQFYKGAVDPTGQNVLALGGAQDDFVSLYTGNTDWPAPLLGDGGDCAISATDPLNSWAMSVQAPDGLMRTLVGFKGGSLSTSYYTDANQGIVPELPFSMQFYNHFEKAPYNDDLLILGTARLWRCNSFFSAIPSWSSNSPVMLDSNSAPVPISAMAFAPSHTAGLVYAFGTADGQLRVTHNGGMNWSDLDPANVLPNRYVSGLAFSPTNTNVLYVTFSGFNASTPSQPGHLFNTLNAFASPPTWTDVSPPVDLPNNCLAIDPNDGANIFVGTDIGLWNTSNGGSSWIHYGPASGLPNVAVYDLRFNSKSQLTAFTHGRGAYLLTQFHLPIIVLKRENFHPTPNCLTCPPDIAWLNPGDLVSVEIPLQNVLPIDTVDLTATLLPSPQITPVVGTQDYGVIKGLGASVSRVFKFIVGGGSSFKGPGSSCGDTLQAVFQLQDQGTNLGQVSIPIRLGVPSYPLVENFEEGPPPPLPPGWTSAATGADSPWATTTNSPPNLPVLGEDSFAVPPPSNTSVFISDAAGIGQSFLVSPPFPVATTRAQLSFLEAFVVSNAFDGAILEISTNGQPFQEIVRAGGSFVKDGYNAVLNDFNPLGPRPAWSGNSGGWLPVLVNLPPLAAGQNVQLRWHFAGSRGITNGAWFVDSVLVTEPICLPPVSNPVILNPKLSGSSFTFAINTVSNRNYVIQYKANLDAAVWQTLETLSGNGSQQIVRVPIGPDSHRFYRFIVQ